MPKKNMIRQYQRGGVVLELQPPGQLLEKALAETVEKYRYRVESQRLEREAQKERDFAEEQALYDRQSRMNRLMAQTDADNERVRKQSITDIMKSDVGDLQKAQLIEDYTEGKSTSVTRNLRDRSQVKIMTSELIDNSKSYEDLNQAMDMAYQYPDIASGFKEEVKTRRTLIDKKDILLKMVDDDIFKRYYGTLLTRFNIESAPLEQMDTLLSFAESKAALNKYDRNEQIEILQGLRESYQKIVKSFTEEGRDIAVPYEQLKEVNIKLDAMTDIGEQPLPPSLPPPPSRLQEPSLEGATYKMTGPGGDERKVELSEAKQLYAAGYTYEKPVYNIDLSKASKSTPPENLVPNETFVEGPDGKMYTYVGFEEGTADEARSALRQLSGPERVGMSYASRDMGQFKRKFNKMYLKDSEGNQITVSAEDSNNYQAVPTSPEGFTGSNDEWSRMKIANPTLSDERLIQEYKNLKSK